MKKLFSVLEGKTASFFEHKAEAKLYRNAHKGAKLTFGPDHPNHPDNRKIAGWNKGRHPKKNKINTSTMKAFRK